VAATHEPLPPLARGLVGAYLETARIIGDRTGQLHRVLASDTNDPSFAPEPLAPFHLRALYQSVKGTAAEAMRQLPVAMAGMTGPAAAIAGRVLASQTALEPRIRPLLTERVRGARIRVHGDYHLGQLLSTGPDIAIIDLEGDARRPVSERRLKRPALVDCASMLASFRRAALLATSDYRTPASDGGDERTTPWTDAWWRWVTVAFLSGYRAATAGAAFLPSDDTSFSTLLDALLIAQASTEILEDLSDRPDQVWIPLSMLAELLAEDGAPITLP
jgi:maltose alpha-D-glucosyltransferase/alpha-amylase